MRVIVTNSRHCFEPNTAYISYNSVAGQDPHLSTGGRQALGDAQQEAKNMSEKAQNVQDVFLNHLRKNKTPVTIFLVNGVKLQGIVTWFDNFSVLLRRDGHSQLVYKHAISTIMPVTPVQLFDGDKPDAAG
jgi:host factor-I protein